MLINERRFFNVWSHWHLVTDSQDLIKWRRISNTRWILFVLPTHPVAIFLHFFCNKMRKIFNEIIKWRPQFWADRWFVWISFWFQHLGWPSGKSVRLGSCRLGFDSKSRQTIDFKIGIHSFPAWRSALKGQCGAEFPKLEYADPRGSAKTAQGSVTMLQKIKN